MPEFARSLARRWGERDLLVTPDKRLTYAEAERSTRRIGKELVAQGIRKGSRVGFMFANTPEWILTWMALARVGAIAMPFPTTYRPFRSSAGR